MTDEQYGLLMRRLNSIFYALCVIAGALMGQSVSR